MRVLFQIKGRTPLVMHNIRLADPDDDFVKKIGEINKKGTRKTEDDRREVERLEWFGGVYHDPTIGIYVPSDWIIKSFKNAGAITKQGTSVVRALALVTDRMPLDYDGPKKLEELYARPDFKFRKIVGVQRSRVVRMRPIFRQWGFMFEAELLTDVMDPEALNGIAQQAGRSAGFGDARILGYGRFDVEMLYDKAQEAA